jgi:uncharacterized protein YegJ (DUF2314 family)
MKQIIIILVTLIAIGCTCCNSNLSKKIERENQPTMYSLLGTDEKMNNAIETARQTLNNFNTALREKGTNTSDFFLKVRFEINDMYEHIWIANITYRDNEYFGIINNLPEYTTTVKLGDTIQINKKDITDWMYIQNKTTYGGYTIRLLRERMSDAEKKQFDSENDIIFAE